MLRCRTKPRHSRMRALAAVDPAAQRPPARIGIGRGLASGRRRQAVRSRLTGRSGPSYRGITSGGGMVAQLAFDDLVGARGSRRAAHTARCLPRCAGDAGRGTGRTAAAVSRAHRSGMAWQLEVADADRRAIAVPLTRSSPPKRADVSSRRSARVARSAGPDYGPIRLKTRDIGIERVDCSSLRTRTPIGESSRGVADVAALALPGRQPRLRCGACAAADCHRATRSSWRDYPLLCSAERKCHRERTLRWPRSCTARTSRQTSRAERGAPWPIRAPRAHRVPRRQSGTRRGAQSGRGRFLGLPGLLTVPRDRRRDPRTASGGRA